MIEPTLRIVRPAETDSDTAALARVAQGDLTALGELYTRHAPALLRFAKHAVGGQAAEDLVQATFIKAVERASTYDGRSTSARGWLYGIAGRLSQERRRALGRFARALLADRPGQVAILTPKPDPDDWPGAPIAITTTVSVKGRSGLKLPTSRNTAALPPD